MLCSSIYRNQCYNLRTIGEFHFPWNYSFISYNWGGGGFCFNALIPQMVMEHSVFTHFGIKFQGARVCPCVSVHSGCYNKMPQTEWLLNKRNSLLRVLEAGSLRSGSAWSGSGGSSLPNLQAVTFSPCAHVDFSQCMHEGRELFLCLQGHSSCPDDSI